MSVSSYTCLLFVCWCFKYLGTTDLPYVQISNVRIPFYHDCASCDVYLRRKTVFRRPKHFRILMWSLSVCSSIHQSVSYRCSHWQKSWSHSKSGLKTESFNTPPTDMLPVHHRSKLRSKQPSTLAMLPSTDLDPVVCLMCSSLVLGKKLEYEAWTLAAVTNFMMYQQSKEVTDVELNSKVWLNMLI